jgi:hypothetical protein
MWVSSVQDSHELYATMRKPKKKAIYESFRQFHDLVWKKNKNTIHEKFYTISWMFFEKNSIHEKFYTISWIFFEKNKIHEKF